jgi:hypothetical protein
MVTARRIENGQYDLVVHYLQKTGHQTAEVLKPAAEPGGVAWVDTRTAGRSDPAGTKQRSMPAGSAPYDPAGA